MKSICMLPGYLKQLSVSGKLRKISRLIIRCVNGDFTDIRILFTNYDIIAYFLNLASCLEHFISIKHRILETFNINKKK